MRILQRLKNPSLAIPKILLVLFTASCVSQKTANLRTQNAYMSGQIQASRDWQRDRPPQVVVHGHVRNAVVQWTEDMTLSRAVVAADYTGFMNPVQVRVIRKGQMIDEMKGIDLLHGKDLPLEPGDIVDITP